MGVIKGDARSLDHGSYLDLHVPIIAFSRGWQCMNKGPVQVRSFP